MPQPDTPASSAAASVDDVLAEARQIIAAHDQKQTAAAKPTAPRDSPDASNARQQPPAAKPNQNGATTKNENNDVPQQQQDRHNQKPKESPPSTTSSAAQTVSVRNNNKTKTKNKNTNKNGIVVDTSGSAAVKAAAAVATTTAADAATSPKCSDEHSVATLQISNKVAENRKPTGKLSGEDSFRTLQTSNKSRPQAAPSSAPKPTTATTPRTTAVIHEAMATISEAASLDRQSSSPGSIKQTGSTDFGGGSPDTKHRTTVVADVKDASSAPPTSGQNRMNKARNSAKTSPDKHKVAAAAAAAPPSSATDASVDGSLSQRSAASVSGSGGKSVGPVAARPVASSASPRSDARTSATAPLASSSPNSSSNTEITPDYIENGRPGDRGIEEGNGTRTFDNEDKPTYHDERTFVERNRKTLLLGLGLVVIVASIVGIAVAASSKKSSAADPADADRYRDNGFGTPAPTPSFFTLDSVLSNWSPDGGVSMKTLPFSPQGMAYAWIKADLEALGYDPDDLSGYDESVAAFKPRRMADRVKTRYALSVLNYTFWGGSGTGVATYAFDAWSHDNDECEFARVFCVYNGEGLVDGLVRVLDLDEAEIPEGTVLPGEVVMLNSLHALIFTSTRLGGKIPDVFFPMKELRVLDLDDCVFTGTVPSSIGALFNLEELRLNDNILEGPLPDLFWNHDYLRVLELQKNLFTGAISKSIFSLGASLEDLRIGDNELTGTIPTQIGNLRNLERFWAYTNQLTGKIPTQIGQLSLLHDLAIDDNRLSGAIPKQLASCPLIELWLNTNRLSSSIPTALGDVFELENLYLDENLLTGVVSSYMSLRNEFSFNVSMCANISSSLISTVIFSMPCRYRTNSEICTTVQTYS